MSMKKGRTPKNENTLQHQLLPHTTGTLYETLQISLYYNRLFTF